jgi:uncharacterized protein YkwD
MGRVRVVPGNRRPRPGLLLLALVLVCAAPLGVAAATGLSDSTAPADEVATDGRSPQRAAATTEAGDEPGDAATTGSDETSPPPTGIADIPPADRAPSTTGPPPAEATPGAAPPATAPPATPGSTVPPQVSPVDQVVALVNDARAHAATPCGPIQLEPRLTAAAQAHSDDMAARSFFDHTNPDGVTYEQRITTAGFTRRWGENIAKGQRSAEQVMQAWMGSPPHRENLENCAYTYIGIGLNRAAWTWTQDFAS